MAERRISLILTWMEENPQALKKVRSRLRSLASTYGWAKRRVQEFALSQKNQNKLAGYVTKTYEEQKAGVVRALPSVKMVDDSLRKMHKDEAQAAKEAARIQVAAQKELGKQQSVAQGRMRSLASSLGRLGSRLGWFGFRLVSIGRIFMRWITKPIQDTINSLVNWEKTLENVAFTMALLEYEGMLTGEMAEFLGSTIDKLPEIGLQMQAAFGALTAVLAGIAIDVGPVLIDILLELANALLGVWNEVKPVLIPALEALRDDVLPPLIELINKVGPALAIGFVDGISAAIPFLINLGNAMEPLMVPLGEFFGWVVALSPALLVLGTALFFVSPLLSLLSGGLTALNLILPMISGAGGVGGLAGLSASLLTVGIAIGGIVVLIATLQTHWDELVAYFDTTVSPAIVGVQEAFTELMDVLGIDWAVVMEAVKIATQPVADALKDIADGIAVVLDLVERFIRGLTNIIIALQGVGTFLSGLFGNSVGAMIANDLNIASDAFTNLGDVASRATKTMETINPEITTSTRNVSVEERARSRLSNLGYDEPGIPGSEPSEIIQQITVYSTMEIENVSSDIDLMELEDAANRGTAEALRRRGLY